MSARWIGALREDGEVLFRIGREGEELVAEWVGLCVLRSDRAGERVRFSVEPGADPALARKVERGLAAALVRHLHGETTLHASCVVMADPSRADGGCAVALVGKSGAGKSTIAAYLCAARGAALIADDVVRVTVDEAGALAHPTEREHWLGVASRRALAAHVSPPPGPVVELEDVKLPTPARAVASAPARLAALFALVLDDETSAVTVRPLRGQAAVGLLIPSLVRFVLDEPRAHIDEIERMQRLVRAAPLYELRAPRSFDALGDVAARLEAAAGVSTAQRPRDP